jgi:hypothetical protein
MHLFHAYLDAGSASMLLQLVRGGFAAVAVAAKLYWGRLMRLLRIRKPEPEAAAPETTHVASEPAPVGGPQPTERAFGETRSR